MVKPLSGSLKVMCSSCPSRVVRSVGWEESMVWGSVLFFSPCGQPDVPRVHLVGQVAFDVDDRCSGPGVDFVDKDAQPFHGQAFADGVGYQVRPDGRMGCEDAGQRVFGIFSGTNAQRAALFGGVILVKPIIGRGCGKTLPDPTILVRIAGRCRSRSVRPVCGWSRWDGC